MKYNPEIHHRRSIRLKDYDYSQEGHYFITVCTQDKRCLFGTIQNDTMILNGAGRMIEYEWKNLCGRFPFIELDEYVVMPNHLHGIIIVRDNNASTTVGAGLVPAQIRATTRVAPTVGDIAGVFKSITTKEYINGVKNNNWKPFNGKLWQRNYYEHIIRNEDSFRQIRGYINNNPCQWQQDELFTT